MQWCPYVCHRSDRYSNLIHRQYRFRQSPVGDKVRRCPEQRRTFRLCRLKPGDWWYRGRSCRIAECAGPRAELPRSLSTQWNRICWGNSVCSFRNPCRAGLDWCRIGLFRTSDWRLRGSLSSSSASTGNAGFPFPSGLDWRGTRSKFDGW